MLYLLAPLSDYRLVYSPLVEAEAQRHQKPGHVPVSVLRERWDWTLVPDGGEAGDLTDTDPKDLPVLASAIQAGAAFLVTGNVRHFGAHDLEAHGLSAVHPGLFLAHHTSAEKLPGGTGCDQRRPTARAPRSTIDPRVRDRHPTARAVRLPPRAFRQRDPEADP